MTILIEQKSGEPTNKYLECTISHSYRDTNYIEDAQSQAGDQIKTLSIHQ